MNSAALGSKLSALRAAVDSEQQEDSPTPEAYFRHTSTLSFYTIGVHLRCACIQLWSSAAAGCQQVAEVIKAYAGVLLQVLVNPHVPQVNKHQAEQRYQQLYNSCSSTIEAWVSATCQQQTFQLLQPAMQGIADAMESSVAAGNHMPSADTSNSGKLMEATALQVGLSHIRQPACMGSTLWCV